MTTTYPIALAYYPPVPPPQRVAAASPVASTGNATLDSALALLAGIRHLPQDEQTLQGLGVNLTFRNGAEALQLIRAKNIRVAFGDMGDSLAHAQWVREQNLIMINQRYQHDASPATRYAISEAIYHEAGHAARLGDDQSSLQEEIDCLALNALAYRYHAAENPAYALEGRHSRLIADGVALYAHLFFTDPNPARSALVNRVIEKYGNLPPASPDHPTPVLCYALPLVDRVLREMHRRQATQEGGPVGTLAASSPQRA